jgi:RNA polymerase sigma factor (sigma-70 family)
MPLSLEEIKLIVRNDPKAIEVAMEVARNRLKCDCSSWASFDMRETFIVKCQERPEYQAAFETREDVLGHKRYGLKGFICSYEGIRRHCVCGPSPSAPRQQYGLRLMPSVDDVDGIPTGGRNLTVVAVVDHRLHFRIFDRSGVVVDTDETRLTGQAQQIEDLRKQLESLWPPHELTNREKARIITAVTSIVGHTLQPIKFLHLSSGYDLPDHGPGPEEDAERNEDDSERDKLIGQVLEQIQGTPLELHVLRGLSYKEIATETGLTVEQVRAKLHQLRTKLRKRFPEL